MKCYYFNIDIVQLNYKYIFKSFEFNIFFKQKIDNVIIYHRLKRKLRKKLRKKRR